MRFRFGSSESQAFSRFFRHLPLSSQLAFYAAVFACFAPIGLLTDAANLGRTSAIALAIVTVYSGGIAVLYAGLALARVKWLPLAVITHTAFALVLPRLLPLSPKADTLDHRALIVLEERMTAVSIWTIGFMALSYGLFVTLFSREGRRFASAQTEMRLAEEIHRTLVPGVHGRDQSAEWLGRSIPSGQVGGDLVDVIATEFAWWGVIADVTGHGVAAGVMMGMFKTALYAHVGSARTPGELLTRIDQTLELLRQPNMFVTAACLRRRSATEYEFALAGHPPILHVSAATAQTTWVGESHLAIGFGAAGGYPTSVLTVAPGDVLLVITDGLLDVFDAHDREIGPDGIANTVRSAPRDAALTDLNTRLFDACRQHGPQLDDQTALLIRIA